jgi:N-terminal glycosyl-hydrolase-114-associated domain/Kelch motif/Galactose oxidase, central domain
MSRLGIARNHGASVCRLMAWFLLGIGLALPRPTSAQTATWTSAGNMTTARSSHTATLLNNGDVLVAGGWVNSTVTDTASAEIYNPSTNSWTVVGSMANARYNHTATLLSNGEVLVAGGDATGTSAEIYNPTTQTWTATGSMNVSRYGHTATLLPNGMVLVAGGCCTTGIEPGTTQTVSEALTSSELWNPATGQWTLTGSMANMHAFHTANLLTNGTVLVEGGTSLQLPPGPEVVGASEVYNPATGTWTTVGSLNVARYYATSGLLTGDEVLVAGGDGGGCCSGLSSDELYSTATQSWQEMPAMTAGAYLLASALLSNGAEMLVSGGYSCCDTPNSVMNTAQIFTPATQTWAITASMSQARYSHTLTALSDGSVLAAGGTNTAGSAAGITSAERFYNGTPPPQITITSNVATIIFSVTGTGCSAGSYLTPTTLTWTPSASCTVQVSPSTPYQFVSWSDGSTANPRTFVAPSTNTTYSFTVKNTSSTPGSISASSGTPQSAMVGTAFANPLVALVENSSGNPVSGATVTFTAPSSGASGSFAGGVNTAVTNSSGLAASALFTANSTTGSYNVTASVAGVSNKARFRLTNQAAGTNSITATSGTPQTATVGAAFANPLVVTVENSSGVGVSGVTVTFAAPTSGQSGSFAGGVNTATTNASGVATSAAFTANSTAGSYTVTASVSGVSKAASFALTNQAGSPASITATGGTPQSAQVGTAFASRLSATVTDSDGNAVNGVTVTFTAPTSGASGSFAGGVNTATTNASGVATSAAFTANATTGSYTVTASVSGVSAAASFALTNQASTSPASITATSGTPQSATVGAAFASPLVATVLNSSGTGVSGVTVTFTAPSSGASGSFAGGVNTATTNASGVATSPVFTANSTAGSYTVTASVSGVSTAASFALTNSAVTGSGSAITLVPSSYVTTVGTTGGQAVASSIDILDESGTTNTWNKYVEFDGLYAGYQVFTLPTTIAASSVTNMQVEVNYQGPSAANQTWTWSIYNWTTAAYVTVGTNAGAPDWGAWTILTFTVPGTLSNYVNPSNGQIWIQLSSNNSSDSADIDYEAVIATY